jgi:hypothetical protein
LGTPLLKFCDIFSQVHHLSRRFVFNHAYNFIAHGFLTGFAEMNGYSVGGCAYTPYQSLACGGGG